MRKEYVVAHDLGTSGNKATLFDSDGNLLASSFSGYNTSYPSHGWAEQSQEDWWQSVVTSTKDLMEKVPDAKKSIVAISFSGQMMSCCPVDKDGEPLFNAIIWSDQRSYREKAELSERIGDDAAYKVTGTVFIANYLAAKILWLRNNFSEIYKKCYKFLHSKDYVAHKMTGEFVTDYSDASGTNLFDIQKKKWWEDVIKEFDIDEDKLPIPVPSTHRVGNLTKQASGVLGLPSGIPVIIGGGDGPCATVGAGASKPGDCYNIYGTSSWISLTTNTPLYDKERRTFILNHLDENLYMGVGTMQSAGGSFEWLNKWLGGVEKLIGTGIDLDSYSILSLEAQNAEAGSKGVLFLPYLMGERSPYWDTEVKGAFLGLTRVAGRNEIIRSVLEGTIYHLKLILDILEENSSKVKEVRVIGGGARNRFLRKLMADIWGKPIVEMHYLEEATSLGAAIAGLVGIGVKKSIVESESMVKRVSVEHPEERNTALYDRYYEIFKESYSALKAVHHRLDSLVKDIPEEKRE
jgi:xylulokinase